MKKQRWCTYECMTCGEILDKGYAGAERHANAHPGGAGLRIMQRGERETNTIGTQNAVATVDAVADAQAFIDKIRKAKTVGRRVSSRPTKSDRT